VTPSKCVQSNEARAHEADKWRGGGDRQEGGCPPFKFAGISIRLRRNARSAAPVPDPNPAVVNGVEVRYPRYFDLDLPRRANNSERPMTLRELSSFGGAEIPSKALLDFHGLSAYM